MKVKTKNVIKTVFEEVIANGIGWVAGLLSVDLLDLFFIKKSIWNLGGLFSKKAAVSGTTFSLLEWVLTAVIGFVVMLIVNKFVRKKLIERRKKRAEDAEQEELEQKIQEESINNQITNQEETIEVPEITETDPTEEEQTEQDDDEIKTE